MKKIGLTGTIASGKTSVAILLRRRGLPVFNADNYAKRALHQGNECYDALVELLGKDVLDFNGDIVKEKMAKVIFNDEEKRLAVNAVVHPYVKKGLEKFFVSHENDPLVFAEVPLLFEAYMEEYFDVITVITCDKDVAIRRMMEDREYTEEQAEARYNSQLDPEVQIAKADKVIYNNADLKALDHEVNVWIGAMRREVRHGNAG